MIALETYLGDRNMNFRKPVMRALGALGLPGSIPALERVLHQSPQVSEQKTAREAIAAIREKKPDDRPNETAKKLDEATADRKRLEERIDIMEKRFDAIKPAPTASDTTSSDGTRKSPGK
jgi:hypothetical protein